MGPTRKYIKDQSSGQINAISRQDIENKLDEIDEIIQDATDSSKEVVRFAIGAGVVGLVVIAFFVGKRKGLRARTIVSFTKAR